MRVGKSPTRSLLTDYRPARVTICVPAFVPEQMGCFAHRCDVLKLCLHRIVKHTNSPHGLMVFDTRSCSDVVDYRGSLRDQGLIQTNFPGIPASGVFTCRIPELPLSPDIYTVFISCGVEQDLADRIENAGQFEVLPADIYGTGRIPSPKDGVIALHMFTWDVGP